MSDSIEEALIKKKELEDALEKINEEIESFETDDCEPCCTCEGCECNSVGTEWWSGSTTSTVTYYPIYCTCCRCPCRRCCKCCNRRCCKGPNYPMYPTYPTYPQYPTWSEYPQFTWTISGTSSNGSNHTVMYSSTPTRTDIG